MNLHEESEYLKMKKLVVENEFLNRQKRNRKYIVAHSALLGFAVWGWLARRDIFVHDPGRFENYFWVVSMLGLLMLAPVLLRAISDHIRTVKKLRTTI